MGTRSRSKSSRKRVRARRQRLRQQGLRPIQIWVPDVRSPLFAAEARRQSLAVARSPHAEKDRDFIEAISEELISERRARESCSRMVGGSGRGKPRPYELFHAKTRAEDAGTRRGAK